MNARAIGWVAAVVLVAVLSTVPAGAHVALPPASSPRPSSSSSDAILNYNVPGDKDVENVATSPDGTLVAAITTGEQVLLFSPGSSGSFGPIAIFTVPSTVNLDAAAIALSDASGSSSAVLVIGYAGIVQAYNVSAAWSSASPTNLNSETPAWQVLNFTVEFNIPTDSTPPYVHAVAISDNGQWIVVQAGYALAGQHNAIIAYYDNYQLTFGHTYFGEPVGVDIDAGGDWIIAGMNIGGAASSLMVFQGTHGWIGNFTQFIGGTGLLSIAIAGSGQLSYGVTYGGIYVVETGTQTLNRTIGTSNVTVAANGEVSPSYSGSQFVFGGDLSAYYFNYTQKSWTEEWSGSFPDQVINVSIAARNPNYFAVSTGNALYYYYVYGGMPQTASADYRTFTTLGDIHQMVLSNSGLTMAVGSTYINGESSGTNGTFSLSVDTGIPTPPAPILVLTPISASAGDTSASIQASWSENWNGPITGQELHVNLSSLSKSGNLPVSPVVVNPGTYQTSLTGLSFGTTYCAYVTVDAYDGATYATSSVVCATTAATPQAVDPVQPYEYAAVGVLGVGVVGLVVLTVMGVTGGAAAGGLRRGRKEAPPSGPDSMAPPPGGP